MFTSEVPNFLCLLYGDRKVSYGEFLELSFLLEAWKKCGQKTKTMLIRELQRFRSEGNCSVG